VLRITLASEGTRYALVKDSGLTPLNQGQIKLSVKLGALEEDGSDRARGFAAQIAERLVAAAR
jgi:hypothetical protein